VGEGGGGFNATGEAGTTKNRYPLTRVDTPVQTPIMVLVAALIFGVFASNIIAAYLCFFCVRRWYYRERDRIRLELETTLRAFVTSPDASTPSPLGVFMDTLATLFAGRLIAQFKHMAGGVQSGLSIAADHAAQEELSSQSPLIALVMGIMPKGIRKALIKNPGMLAALSTLGKGNHGSDSSESTQIATRPRRD